MQSYLDRGYDVVKMKIGAVPLDEDIRRIEAVLEVVGDGRRLAVDANGRFDLKTAYCVRRSHQTVQPVLVRRSWRSAGLCTAG